MVRHNHILQVRRSVGKGHYCDWTTPSAKISQSGHVKQPWKTKVLAHIKHSNYLSAFRLMLEKSRRAVCHMHKCIEKEVRRELAAYKKSSVQGKMDLSLTAIEDFSWEKMSAELKSGMPWLWEVLQAVICRRRVNGVVEKQSAISSVILTTLFIRFPRSFTFFQKWNSLQLFKHGNCHAVRLPLFYIYMYIAFNFCTIS